MISVFILLIAGGARLYWYLFIYNPDYHRYALIKQTIENQKIPESWSGNFRVESKLNADSIEIFIRSVNEAVFNIRYDECEIRDHFGRPVSTYVTHYRLQLSETQLGWFKWVPNWQRLDQPDTNNNKYYFELVRRIGLKRASFCRPDTNHGMWEYNIFPLRDGFGPDSKTEDFFGERFVAHIVIEMNDEVGSFDFVNMMYAFSNVVSKTSVVDGHNVHAQLTLYSGKV
ncbi:MAG: hypothetical protein NUW37_17990 [Planctomycetes bacterium]|nr:hypothetical protein [Planctomycetota bacterium]MCR4318238.1 hypothetical protein [Planctomycetota bacterium]